MAEWLRRWTRNPMGYSRTGSNPVHSAALFYVSKISFFPPKNIYFSFFFCKRGWHCWCSGIIQDSHSWDLGSIPRQCRKPTYFFYQKTWLVSSKDPYFPGSTQIWTGDLSICSRMLYHWAIPPWQVERLLPKNLAEPRLVLQKVLSDVGFEPTPSSEDQNSHDSSVSQSKVILESGALDHSANLTCWVWLQISFT